MYRDFINWGFSKDFECKLTRSCYELRAFRAKIITTYFENYSPGWAMAHGLNSRSGFGTTKAGQFYFKTMLRLEVSHYLLGSMKNTISVQIVDTYLDLYSPFLIAWVVIFAIQIRVYSEGYGTGNLVIELPIINQKMDLKSLFLHFFPGFFNVLKHLWSPQL